jgi:S-(hydroxymethyl)glutathione dehydrogenase/alcohol dehydrogenase
LSVVRVDESVPLESAVLVGCGVPTGWGSAIYAGGVAPGDTTIVYGTGGVGINAIQGAVMAGAKYVVAVDPLEFKRQKALEFGATHAFTSAAEAQEKVIELTYGMGADQALVISGTPDETTVSAAVDSVGPGGTVVLTGVTNEAIKTVHVPGGHLTNWGKTIKGSLFGGCNPQFDIPNLIGLYQAGKYKLDELVTRRYRLEEVNQGYQDLVDGKNLRGVIIHDS